MDLLEYYTLATRQESSLTADERESLAYVRADIALRQAQENGHGVRRSRAGNWVAKANELRRVAHRLERMPRASDDVPRGLLHWVSYQRRNAGRHNGYQVAFLESVTGWTWAPFDDDWDRREAELRDFLVREGRPPRTRAESASERALAKWTARQRQLNARGQLPYQRAAALRGMFTQR